MWIFCGGMKRSGSTLQYQIASQLVEQAGIGIRIKWYSSSQFPELRDKYTGVHRHKVFKSHDCTPEIAREISEGDALGFHIYRDLRDVIASQMQMSRVTFNQLWSAGFLQECVENYSQWTALERVASMRYEDIVQDLPRLVHLMVKHIGLGVSREECKRIAADFDLESQRSRIEESKQKQCFERVAAIGDDLLFDPHSLLHSNHIQSGRSGVWRGILTPEEARRVDVTFGDWLYRHGYSLGSRV